MFVIRRLATTVLIASAVVTAGCAGRTTPPEPAVPETRAAVPQPTPPTLIPVVGLANDTNAVPPFADTALIKWGPEPAGTVHVLPPHEYDLQDQSLRVRFDWPHHTVVGSTTLRVAALDHAMSDIPLDAVAMTIRRVATSGGVPLKFDYDGQMLVVHLARPLAPRARTSFTVDYVVVRPKKGAYFIDRNHYLWTQGEAEDNRYWIPTYDHPDDKTTWEISVLTDTGESALSNGKLVSKRSVRGGVLWSWAQTQPASTYLMSVVTGKYAIVEAHWGKVPVEYWTYPDSVAAGRLGFGKTPDAIDVFSSKTGIPYPWAKYAQSVVPDFIFGGMENVTATTQNDNGILHPAWAEPQYNADGLMAHELGHQWFGDLLTTRDWSQIWLNEGFATFMEQTYREASRGVDEGMWDRMGAEEQAIAGDRRNRRSLVFNRYVENPMEMFGGPVYPKGAIVLQMLRHQLGDSLFWSAMHHYATSHMYANVVTAELEGAFEESTGRNYRTFFDQWIYGAGFPVFRVSASYDSTTERLALHADEIQPRDSLTGDFDTDVDVEVLTDAGPARAAMQVRNGKGDLTIALTAAPRAINWNKGSWVLCLTDFPRSTAMLDYQLAHSDDVAGRNDALALLGERTHDRAAARAVAIASRSDPFWALRARAVALLTAFPGDTVARDSALSAVRDQDSRVRQSAVGALARFPGADTNTLLANEARSDASPIVRGFALASYIRVAGDAALPLAAAVMAENSWRNVLRTPAMTVLKGMQGAAAQNLYEKYAKP